MELAITVEVDCLFDYVVGIGLGTSNSIVIVVGTPASNVIGSVNTSRYNKNEL